MLKHPAAIDAIRVVTPARAEEAHLLFDKPYPEPTLNPNHPQINISIPKQTINALPSGSGFVPFSYRPIRGPMNQAETNAPAPKLIFLIN